MNRLLLARPTLLIRCRARGYAAEFYRFSLEYPYYYDPMFSFHVPSYLDYAGTAAERLLLRRKRWP